MLLIELFHGNVCSLTPWEIVLSEAILYSDLYDELLNQFQQKNERYFFLVPCSLEEENRMFEGNFVRLIIQDILITEEYTLEGIAYHTKMPEDVVLDYYMGFNANPSAVFLKRLIQLHGSVRKEFYHEMMQKIFLKYKKHKVNPSFS